MRPDSPSATFIVIVFLTGGAVPIWSVTVNSRRRLTSWPRFLRMSSGGVGVSPVVARGARGA